MQVLFKTQKEEMLLLDNIEPSSTVWEMKGMIETKTGVARKDQRIIYNGELLDDKRKCIDCRIQNLSILNLALRLNGDGKTPILSRFPTPLFELEPEGFSKLRIYVRGLTGKNIPFDILPSTSIEDIKGMIRKVEGFPVHDQSLHYLGLHLHDGFTASDYDIRDEGTIELCLRIRQGVGSTFAHKRKVARKIRPLVLSEISLSLYPIALSKFGNDLDILYGALRNKPYMLMNVGDRIRQREKKAGG
mmetsp:Transcript_152/g.248  ORF Transcript_152/g.248 Transcript_152/m.248 type:complete len:246 (-) Transcript_152:269-1006(-)